jgi:preprotein translocase subunit SecD
MFKTRITALLILIIGLGVGFFVYQSEISNRALEDKNSATGIAKFPFRLGLDLSGGSHLIYRADVSKIDPDQVPESMNALRDVIERRVNLFGVSEPVVQVQGGGFSNDGENRLIIDLPGVTDVSKAISMIGQTPLLEFKVEKNNTDGVQEITIGPDGQAQINLDSQYVDTELTGRYLSRANLEFDPNTGEPYVGLVFDAEGSKLFEKITRENIGKSVAIYLDGAPISAPVVREAITGGVAQISGNFTPLEAKTLVGRLNSGALPVPIEHIATETIGPSLGATATAAGARAALIGFIAIALFLLVWYRLPGLVAVFTLGIYVSIILAIFKLLPVTLTAAGIAGFIISIGIAVDANVLVFERIKEELKIGRSINEAISNGFSRAWFSIRDSNISSMLTAAILYAFGTTLIKGFALTFFLGVLISMFSAIVVSRLFLYSFNFKNKTKLNSFLFGSGFSNAKFHK